MRTILFARQFAPLVFTGWKNCTIRRHRYDRPVSVGERMSLRAWSGLPYRSKQVRIRDITVMSVEDLSIYWCTEWDGSHTLDVRIGRQKIDWFTLERIAKEDGFPSTVAFLKWFVPTENSFFCGRIIRWQPRALLSHPKP